MLNFSICSAYAAHPLVSEDNTTQGSGRNQIELNSDFASMSNVDTNTAAFTYTYGISDAVEKGTGTTPLDTDGDGTPDYRDMEPEKAKAEAPVEPEPKLAAEIVAREEIAPEAELAAVDAEVLVTVEQAEAIAEPEVDLAALRPPITIAVSKMSKFSNNLAGLEL